MERGSLLKILSDEVKALEFEWTKRVNVVKGLANAISYLHHECCPAIVHRDISSKNVLLDAEYEAHISDFGSARTCDPESSNWTSFAGTFGYSAPGNHTLSFCTYNVSLILVKKKNKNVISIKCHFYFNKTITYKLSHLVNIFYTYYALSVRLLFI